MISEDLARTNLSFCGAQYYSCFNTVGVRDLFDQLIYAIFLDRYKPRPLLFLSVIKIMLFLHNAESFDKKKRSSPYRFRRKGNPHLYARLSIVSCIFQKIFF